MATLITTFLNQVEILLGPDDSNTELTDYHLLPMIRAAVERYSRDRPNDVTEDEVGDDGKYYDLDTLLTDWVEGFSRVIGIQYPAKAISADELPQQLDADDWRDDYWQGGTRYLFFPGHTPTSSETIRITYTAPYVWTGSPESVATPPQDFYAICHLAAGLACQAIATKYSRTSDATITADSASHSSRASEFARRAKEYIAFYENHLGLGGDDGEPPFVQAAGEYIDLDTDAGWFGNREFLYHDRHSR